MISFARKVASCLLVGTLAAAGLTMVSPAPALACQGGTPGCLPGAGDESGGGDSGGSSSSGTQQESYSSGGKSCKVYANGRGMGLYCITLGGNGPVEKTLREMYGKQMLQRCRYRELPPTIQTPYNANPDRGHYMLMSCLDNIDFDTHAGGQQRSINISVVFVENGTDIADRHNGITDFVWAVFATSDTMLPVPFMRTRPNTTPLVGIPTFFTFSWLDPTTKEELGPQREVTRDGVTMRARATKIEIDPNQEGVAPVTCDASTPYLEGQPAKNQPANACSIVFPRSSASARKYATKDIPENIKDAFYADVHVTWEVTYGAAGDTPKELGLGFTMKVRQVLPVQEVQAPNQPPAVIY